MKPSKAENISSSTECIEYTRTFVPSSMRSQYWKYFGFPSDSSNNILTRQKIVCTLCGAAIAYNKNTSNLRTHLAAKHSEFLVQLFKNNTSNNSQSAQTAQSSNASRKRRYSNSTLSPLEFIHDETESFLIKHSNTNVMQSTGFVEMSEPVTQSDSKELLTVTNNIEYKESPFDTIENSVSNGSNDDLDCDGCNDSQTYRLDDLIVQKDKEVMLTNSVDAIIDMLITDLCKISMLTGTGYQQLYGHVDICEVNDLLLTRYTEMECFIRSHLESISHIKPFSLGIESFTNCEEYEQLFIYFNYYDDECNELFNVQYKFAVKSEFCFSEVTKNLKMENCVCIIFNESNLVNILDCDEIPQLLCLYTTLTNCLNKIFKEHSICTLFQEIYKATQQFLKDDQNSLLTPPNVFPPCPWTKLNFLQFVFDKLELNALIQNRSDAEDIREFYEYVSPIKITMETIAEEELPFCTLIRPLIIKLREEHFKVSNTPNSYISTIQQTIESHLQHSILSNVFLEEAVFFDVRFQRDYIHDEHVRENIQKSILERFKSVINITRMQESLLKIEQDSVKGTVRRSGLKQFFSRMSDPSSKGKGKSNTQLSQSKTNIENEFEKYRKESQIDLEQCPIQWWKANSCKYAQLSKVANYYLCVPCCVNRLYQMDEAARIELLNKRFILREFTEERYLWYLHYNKTYFNKLRSN